MQSTAVIYLEVEEIPRHPIETFDFLLRNLVAAELVERVETEEGQPAGWRLSDIAQSRLNHLAAGSLRTVAPEKLVYIDRACSDCGRRALTRLRQGCYLCEICADSRERTPTAAATEAAGA